MPSFLCLFLSLISCFTLFSKPAIIRGQIDGFPADAELTMAMVGINEFLSGQRQVRQEIQGDGSFELVFDLAHPQDIYLRAGGVSQSLLMKPGEELMLQWQYADAVEEAPPVFIHFAGDGAQRNQDFVLMMHQHDTEIDFADNEFMRMGKVIKESSPEVFLNYRAAKKEEQRQFFQNYMQDNNLKDTLIQKWVDYFLTFQPLNDLVMYPIVHAQFNQKRPQDIALPAHYYQAITDTELNDPSAAICSRYIQFLRRDYYVYMRGVPQSEPDYKERMERDGMVATLFHHMLDHSEGLAREVILTRFVLEMMEINESISNQVPAIMEAYYNTVTEKPFIDAVLKKYKLRFDEKNEVKLAEDIQLLDYNSEEGEIIPILARRFKNKVIYIDIWATWCAPCIREMTYYPSLMERYQGKDIVFVFLAAHSPENLWKVKVNEFGLQSPQYLLNEQQYYGLEKYFELHGFPQHLLINRKGEIVESQGPPVLQAIDKLNEVLLDLLDELLEE